MTSGGLSVSAIFVVFPALLLLAACTGSVEYKAALQNSRDKLTNDARTIAAQIRPEHLEQCRKLVESWKNPLYGTSVRITGQLALNMKSTCQLRIESFNMNLAAVAYLAPVTSEATPLWGSKNGTAGCIFTADQGKITVDFPAPVKAQSNSVCHSL